MHQAGRRANVANIFFNSAWRFFRGMILKRGFLDGWRGFAYHLVEAGYVRRKYLRLWMLARSERAKKSPA